MRPLPKLNGLGCLDKGGIPLSRNVYVRTHINEIVAMLKAARKRR